MAFQPNDRWNRQMDAWHQGWVYIGLGRTSHFRRTPEVVTSFPSRQILERIRKDYETVNSAVSGRGRSIGGCCGSLVGSTSPATRYHLWLRSKDNALPHGQPREYENQQLFHQLSFCPLRHNARPGNGTISPKSIGRGAVTFAISEPYRDSSGRRRRHSFTASLNASLNWITNAWRGSWPRLAPGEHIYRAA